MSQEAQEQAVTIVTVEGFEPLFAPVTETPATTHSNTPPDTDAMTVTVTEDAEGWPLKVAAEKLGISPNTIRKRIKAGELRAYKVIGVNGPEWRIAPPSTTHANTPPGTPSNSGTVPATPSVEALLKVIETQAKQLDCNSEQLKAASQVIMYQRSLLEEKDGQIKLLTDNQAGRGLWQRLTSWVMGKTAGS